MSNKTQVTLVLQGDHDDVMELVSLAISENLMQSMDAKTISNGAAPKRTQKLAVGDKVVVQANRSDYDVQIGDQGVIKSVKRTGKGYSLRVKWADGTESPVASSLVKKLR